MKILNFEQNKGWARVNKLVEAFAMIFLCPNGYADVSRFVFSNPLFESFDLISIRVLTISTDYFNLQVISAFLSNPNTIGLSTNGISFIYSVYFINSP